ncbi:NOP seven associated protein 1 [Loa loa]|uniref:NOP seven associated protein 1 n=2 Tax=Loa loa TaxID=7209 RepID=A0A1S0TQ02_LOALO|nr:NOP seven associated protein 1 [Loa loa]EFO18109.2 NOP seven associated protein 1 [Loa loa]
MFSEIAILDCSGMDCFVGASTGALKGISFKDNAFSNINQIASLKPRQDEITCMSWTNEDQTELLTAQMDKQLKLLDTTSNEYTTLFTLENGSGAIKGIRRTAVGTYISAVESGELSVSSPSGEIVKELNAGNNLIAMVPSCEQEGHYATGGKENPLKIWDIEKGEKIFVAKNVRPDELQLRVPIWVNDIRFIPKSQNVVTVTGKHQIRLYDPRTQRRPVKEMMWAEEPLTAMSLCRNEMQIVAGNTRGDIGLFDLRNKMHMVCKYKGCAGSVSGIDAHQSAEYIASCSLDRFVRLHELNSKKLVKKVYCKARLNRILLRDKLSILNNEDGSKRKVENYDWQEIKESGSSEDETLWNDMNQNKERQMKRKLREDDLEKVVKKPKFSKRRKRRRDISKSDISKRKKLIAGPKRKSESTDETAVMLPFKKLIQTV